MASLKLYSVGRLAKYISDSTFQTLRGNVYRSTSSRYYSTEEKTAETDSSDKLPATIEECHKQIEALNTEVASLKDQVKDVEDKYKRALADGENVRRRMMKQVEDAKSFAIQSFCKDLLDMLLFYYFTLVTFYVSSEASSSIVTKNEAEILIQHDLNKCLCSNNLLHKAPDGISDGNDLERLIVYFYRNKVTNEIFMYTPRKIAQYFFPDLPIEDGDDFSTITSETVDQVLKANSNFIRVYSHQSESSGTESEDVADNDSMAIGLNTGIIETTKIRPELVDELPYENDNAKSDNSQSTSFDNTVPIENDNAVEQMKDGKNLIVLPQTDNVNDQSKDYVSGQATTNFGNGVNNCSPDNPQCQHTITSIQNDNYIWSTEKSIHDSQYTLNTESVTEKSLPDSDRTFDIKWNEENHEYNPKSKYFQSILQPLFSLFRKQTTFDGWFNQQIHKLSNNSKQLENTVDLDFLKSRLENILFENHILITKDGVLKNDHDVAINATNLRLHHISIGDIGTYKNLLNIKGSKFSLPPNMRYLDTIIVTQIFPPKLLGIIPLRKRCETNSPKTSYRRMMSNWPFHRPSPAKHLYHHPYHFYSPESTPQEYNDFNEYYSLPNLPKPKKNLRQNEKRNNPGSSFSSKGLGPEKILNTVKSLIDLRVGPVSLPGDLIDLFGSGKQPDEDVDNQDEVEFDDDIGIRIIGGNAATSSGTPLSSKGRSAAF